MFELWCFVAVALLLRQQRSVVVAMISIRMVQVTGHQIIRVISVRHGGMTALVAVRMVGRVLARAVAGRAANRIGRAYSEDMFVCMSAVGTMQVAAIQIVNMPGMMHGQVTTAGAVRVRMGAMRGMA